MARDAPAEFVPLFHAAMAREEARPRLDAFISSLTAVEADACVGAYFAASSDPAYRYSRTDKRSLGVFAALALAALDRGEPLYAVRFEALVKAEGTHWRDRFKTLDPRQQRKLEIRATQKQKALSQPQQKLLVLVHKAVREGHDGLVEKYVSERDFRDAHGCLLAYMETSLRYPPDNARSLRIFYGISSLTIRKGDADFVKQYRRLVTTAGTTWSLRWTALEPFYRGKLEEDLNAASLKDLMAAAQREKAIKAGKSPESPPIPVSTPAPDRLRPDASRRDAPRRTETTRRFLDLFEKFMTAGGDPKARKKELTEYIFNQNLQGLRECFAAYLEASTRYAADSGPSLYIFWGIASRLLYKGKAYEALKLELLSSTPGTIIAQRLAALPPDVHARLTKEMGEQLDKRKRRILDDLRFAYYKRHRADADLAALRAFEPEVDASRRDAVRGAARDCDQTFGRRDAKAFAKTFDAWADLMHPRNDAEAYVAIDPLVHVAMLKWCRELADITPQLRSELYWYGVLALLIASLRRYPEMYDRGLSAEEKEFFLHPSLVPQGYRYDFERRLEFVWWKRASPEQLREVSREHALLLFSARKLDFTLVGMDEAQEIHDLLERLKNEKSKTLDDIRIPINSRFPDAKLRIGATIGKVYIVWWERKLSHAFVEVEGCRRVLFRVDSYLKLGQLQREDSTYGQIWRDTQHLLVAIPGFFQIMGYLPDLVTGGFAGLVTAVVTDMMVDVFAEQAGLSPEATMALSVAANLASSQMMDRALESNGARVPFDQGMSRGTAHHFDIPVAPRGGATGPDAKAPDTSVGPRAEQVPDKLAEEAKPTHEILAARDEPSRVGKGADDDEGPSAAGRDAGSFDDRDAGKTKSGDERQRQTADADPRATRDNGVNRPGEPKRMPLYDLITDENHLLLEDLRSAGWKIHPMRVRKGEGIGPAFEWWIGGDKEWKIVWRIESPSGVKFNADFLARNPGGQGLLIGEAKASGVTDPDKTAHIAWWAEKAEALGRATAISIESEGLLTVEIVCNVAEVVKTGRKSFVAPEAYYNIKDQQIAQELIEKHGRVLEGYFAARGKRGYKASHEEVQSIVERYVEVSDINWGRIGSNSPAKKKVSKPKAKR